MEDPSFSRPPDPQPGEALVVEERAAAVFLSAPESLRYFSAFLAREATAAQVARELGVDTGSVTYRIRRMLDLGLIAQTRVQARAGRPVRHYRSVADAVFVPIALTPAESLSDLFSRGRTDAAASLADASQRAWSQLGALAEWGTHLYRVPGGVINRDFLPQELLGVEGFWPQVLADRSPAVWDQYAQLHLTRALGKELQRELAEVVTRYARASQEGDPEATSPYLVHLAMAPQR